ncbi:MAG: class I SAM-dependent methyltransferase [Candidatus Binatia bacterium]
MEGETAPENDAVMEALALAPTDRVLEVGFGHGRTIEHVGARVTGGIIAGIDQSPDMVALASARCRRAIDGGRTRLLCGDSATLPFPGGFFDKGYAVHTLYFWRPPLAHLREIRRVLRDGGQFVLAYRAKDEAGTTNFPPDVYAFYSADEVEGLLIDSGFRGVDTSTTSRGMTLALARA